MDVKDKLACRAYKAGESDGRCFGRKHGKGRYSKSIYEAEVLRRCRKYCYHHFAGWDNVDGFIKDNWQRGFDKGWLEGPEQEEA